MKVTLDYLQDGWIAKADTPQGLLVATSVNSREHALIAVGSILAMRDLVKSRHDVESIVVEDKTVDRGL